MKEKTSVSSSFGFGLKLLKLPFSKKQAETINTGSHVAVGQQTSRYKTHAISDDIDEHLLSILLNGTSLDSEEPDTNPCSLVVAASGKCEIT